MKKIIIIAAVLVFSLTLFQGNPSQVMAQKKTLITIASGWVTGCYYPLGGSISRILFQNPDLGLRATVESSGASVANSNLIANGDADVAILQNDIAYYAYNGQRMFAADTGNRQAKNMQAICTLYPEYIQIQALKKSNIRTPADLKGKRVCVGPLGSGTEVNAGQILEMYGLTFDDLAKVERLTSKESSDFMKDGRIDAAFYTVGLGAAVLADTAFMTPCTLVNIDDQHAANLIKKYPFYAQFPIKAGTYKDSEEVKTVAVLSMLVTRADMPEKDIYNFTKAIFENLETVHKAHAALKDVSLESAMDGMSVPLHPGAKKYFQEKGIQIPAGY
ncbi:MAG: TAXI family TRAP transporter solute-binding subunit [Desulfatiglandaceae bacterium]